ncbi:hypothetical protein OAE48_02885 [Flavobacteriales bacterium]|nr:hypothetical protein [Flavobacteriales bacterium]
MFFILSYSAVAQENQTEAKKDSTKKPVDITISVGGGAVRFVGDVEDASKQATVHVIGNRTAFDFSFGIGLSKSFTANLNLIYGKLSGNENTFEKHRNFDAQMFQGGVNIEYNFAGLYKKKIPVLNPFINAGVYYSSYFNIGTDLVCDDGTYHYWSDGKIRDIAEDASNADDAVNISRDFTYETFLPKRSIQSGSVSAGLGFDLHLSRPFTVRIMSKYFHSFTDGIDGVDDGSLGQSRDGFFFTTLSLMVHPMGFLKGDKKPESKYRYIINMDELDKEDSDEDGIYDLSDLCAGTPKGIKVDKSGCPLDDDEDGIPNYRDKSADSPKDQIVDQNGIPVDYKLVAEQWSDSPNIYGISWDKEYGNPRFKENAGYTVNIDAIEKNKEGNTNPRILRIPELRKEVINDSIIVYRLGVYEKYETVEGKRKELEAEGINTAYTVSENASLQAADNLAEIAVPDRKRVINSYGIKESIDKIRTATAFKNPQLEYVISRFDRYLFEQVPEEALVKYYLRAMLAFDWDEGVKDGTKLVYARLEEYPIAESKGKVDGIEEFMAETEKLVIEKPELIAESSSEEEEVAISEVSRVMASEEPEIPEAENSSDEEAIESVQIDGGTTIQRETEDRPGAVTERTTIATTGGGNENEIVEDKTEDISVSVETPEEASLVIIAETEEVVESEKPAPIESEKQGNVELSESDILTGDELDKAIEQIRSTSNLNAQPRINYAPSKPKYAEADVNKDQLISALEIQMVLEDILKGESDFDETTFNEMNAYFTDFTKNVEPIDFGGTKVAFVNGTLTILKTEGGEYKSESRRLLARKYREADFDKDGELTPEEVQRMISLFMKGESPYSQEKLHELIDLYFD